MYFGRTTMGDQDGSHKERIRCEPHRRARKDRRILNICSNSTPLGTRACERIRLETFGGESTFLHGATVPKARRRLREIPYALSSVRGRAPSGGRIVDTDPSAA